MTTPGRRIEQRGLWFEEFEPGVTYLHRPGRTVTEADNVLFTTLTMNGQALHLDEAWSATQPFGKRLVNSLFTLSTLVGLSVGQLTQGTIVANLGFREVRFPQPVFHGDTLYAETVVLDARPSGSRPGEGVVTLEHTARNQHGDVVAVAVRSTLVRMRPPDGATSSIPGPALLFCPADRPDRFAKAAAAADAVILDLEDGVAPDDKPRARRALQETLLDPRRTIVRINPAGTDDAARDLDALAGTPYGTVMLAKAEDAEQAAALAPRQVIALCETPRGVLAAPQLAAVPNVIALMWGAEDLVAAIGGPFQPPCRRPLPRRRPARPLRGPPRRRGRVDRCGRLGLPGHRRPRRPARRGRRRGRVRLRREGLHPPAPGRGRPRRLPAHRRGGRPGAARARGGRGCVRGVRVRGPDGRRAAAAPRRADHPCCRETAGETSA